MKYKADYQYLHKTLPDFGQGTRNTAPALICAFLDEWGVQRVLDYGCGKGKMVESLKNQGYACEGYDPCHPDFDRRPTGTFQAVLCIDVMEHIPDEEIAPLLKDIVSFKPDYIYFNIANRLAARILPSGDNAHCTVEPPEWWYAKILTALETYRLSLSYDAERKSTLILCQHTSLQPVESIAFQRASEKGSLVYI